MAICCGACDPTLRVLATDESETYSWEGRIFQHGDDITCESEQGPIRCSEAHEAPAGRYRVEVCFAANYREEDSSFGSCYGEDESYLSPASLDSPSCQFTEFDYDPCQPGSVEVELLDS